MDRYSSYSSGAYKTVEIYKDKVIKRPRSIYDCDDDCYHSSDCECDEYENLLNCQAEIDVYKSYNSKGGLCPILSYDEDNGVIEMARAATRDDDIKDVYQIFDEWDMKVGRYRSAYYNPKMKASLRSTIRRAVATVRNYCLQNNLTFDKHDSYPIAALLAGLEWQPYVRTISEASRRNDSWICDLHAGNIGIYQNRLVVIDFGGY